MNLLVDSTIKVSVVVLLAFAAPALLRRQSAALRHWVLSVGIVCAAAMPLLGLVVPSWHLSMGLSSPAPVTQPIDSITAPVEQATTSAAASSSRLRPLSNRDQTVNVRQLLWPMWMGGVAICFGLLGVGIARLASVASRSERVVGGKWVELTEGISRAYNLRRPVRVLKSDHPTLLVAWGLARPKVLLPAEAGDWPEDRIHVVLRHELAHIQRGDWVVQIAAETLRSVFWFNPLLWIACRRLRRESEHACDDAVLNAGVNGPEYAAHLVDLARAFNEHRRTWLPAPAMARPSSLQRRISAMLNSELNHHPITRSARLAIASAVVAITLPMAGIATSAQTGSAAFTGFVFDSTDAVIPEVTFTLVPTSADPIFNSPNFRSSQPMQMRFTNGSLPDALDVFARLADVEISFDPSIADKKITVRFDGMTPQQAVDDILATNQLSYRVVRERSIVVFPDPNNLKYLARSDRAGYFQFVGLPPGTYFLQARVAGFTTVQDNVMLSEGQTVQRNLTLQVGSVEETITVTRGNGPEATPLSATTEVQPQREPCVGSPVGGRILPPTKIRDVRPQFPENLTDSGVEGRVVLAARIGTDGFVKEARAVPPVNPNLANAAMAAVNQWQFTPTFLNCAPVEVNMTVTVTFNPQR